MTEHVGELGARATDGPHGLPDACPANRNPCAIAAGDANMADGTRDAHGLPVRAQELRFVIRTTGNPSRTRPAWSVHRGGFAMGPEYGASPHSAKGKGPCNR